MVAPPIARDADIDSARYRERHLHTLLPYIFFAIGFPARPRAHYVFAYYYDVRALMPLL